MPWVAAITTVSLALTDETFATNVTLVLPPATVTEGGTVTAALLLDRLTDSPFDGAATFVETVHVSVPAPVIFDLEQLSWLRIAVLVAPLPRNFTVAAGPEEELVMMLNWPVKSVLSFGLKLIFRLRLLPAARLNGTVLWSSTLNAVLEKDNWETSTGVNPVFETERA